MRRTVGVLVVLVACGARIEDTNRHDGSAAPDAALDVVQASDAPAPTWTPARLSHVVLWINDRGIQRGAGDVLKVWNDASSKGNHVYPLNMTNAVVEPKALAGHDVVKVDPAGLYAPASASLEWGTGDFLVGAVVRWGPMKSDKFLYRASEDPFDSLDLRLSDTSVSANVRLSLKLMGLGSFHVVVTRGREPFELVLDHDKATTTSALTNPQRATKIPICAWGESDAELAEMVIATGTITDSDRDDLVSYLQTRFGL